MEQDIQVSTEKIKQDTQEREKCEKLLTSKTAEINAVKERLYELRYDYSRSQETIVRDVKNLCQELNRLEDEVDKLRKDALQSFEASLNLPALGLELLLTTAKKKSVNFKETSNKVITLEESDVPDHETMEFPPENLKLMRTGSTQSMEQKDAKERWQSLYKMFKEWKHQTSVAEAAQIVKHKDKAQESEIIKLRAAIYSLRQRKQLSHTDQKLLNEMSARLAELTRQSKHITEE